ncbi:hypothetical protein SAMN05216330_1011057 [Bradyrhizobium sp. Ghvi]|nr:hypothetical protein SAMN05216330_1011057 [Bradyrhizobium sp. Ghvi]
MERPKDRTEPEPEPSPSRTEEARRIIAQYAEDLKEILRRLRRKLN